MGVRKIKKLKNADEEEMHKMENMFEKLNQFNKIPKTSETVENLAIMNNLMRSSSFLPNIIESDLKGFGGSVDEIIENIKKYVKKPWEIFTGPRSTGDRDKTYENWKKFCTYPQDGTIVERGRPCPLEFAEVNFDYENWVGTCDIICEIKVTWSYDCCNIYDVRADLKIVRNDCSDVFPILKEEFLVLPVEKKVEEGVCHPCTPKCLSVKLTLQEWVEGIWLTSISKRKETKIEFKLCPDGKFTDYTDYTGQTSKDNYKIEKKKGDPKKREGKETTVK